MEKHTKKIVGFNLIEVIIIIVISGVTSSIATGVISMHNSRTSSGTTYAELLQDEGVKSFLDVYSGVVNGYYENVDKNKAIDSAINGMMNYLGDEYTTYLNGDATDSLTNSLAGSYVGIGVYIKDGAIIESTFEDSPAEKAGLQKGDKIVGINNEDVTNKSLEEVTKMIKDKKGFITLSIIRNNQKQDVKVEVKEIDKPAITTTTLEKNGQNIGYMYIETFSTTVANQVEKALKKIDNDKISKLIIDLRNNGGGYLSAASDIASMFLEKGKKIYSLEDKDSIKDYNDETDEKKNLKVVLLVNDGTASASEILTAALKDSYGAEVVGTTTFGKGKVQQTKSLSDGTMVKYTTARWLRPNGECIDNIGIKPDYEVDLIKNENDEIIDTQLEKAIEVVLK